MSDSSTLPLLFTQLQTRYPTSALLTELVQMDVDRCVVRALVQVGTMTLATSMATATTVEQAEDQARLRVLALLGIDSTSSRFPAVPSSYSTPTQPLTNAYALDRATTQDMTPTVTPSLDVEAIVPPPLPTVAFEPLTMPATTFSVTAVEPYITQSAVPEVALETFDPPDYGEPPDYDDALYNQATFEEEPFEEHEPLVVEEALSNDRADANSPVPLAEEPAAKSKPRKSSADKVGVDTPPVSEPDTGSASRDLSSLISQIGVEIDRIGWSKRQGSTYLQKTYGKKTRSELTDDELEDFLTYLNTQPSATLSS